MNIWFQISATDDNSGVKECTVKETMYELVNGSKPETVVNTQTITFEEGEENSASVCIPYQSKTTEDGIIKLEFYDLTDKNGNVLDATNIVYLIKDSGFTLEGVMLKNEFDPGDLNHYRRDDSWPTLFINGIDESKIEAFTLKVPEKFYLNNRAKNLSTKVYAGTDYSDISTVINIGDIDSEFTYSFTIDSDSIDGVYEKDLYIKVCITDDYDHCEEFYSILPRTAKWAVGCCSSEQAGANYYSYWYGFVNASENATLYKINRENKDDVKTVTNYYMEHKVRDNGKFSCQPQNLYLSLYESDNSFLYGKATERNGIVRSGGLPNIDLPTGTFDYEQTALGYMCKITPVFSGTTYTDYFSNTNYTVFARISINVGAGKSNEKLVFFERDNENNILPANVFIPENAIVSAEFSYCNQCYMKNTRFASFEIVQYWNKNITDTKSDLYSIPITYDGKGYVHVKAPAVGTLKNAVYYYKKLSDIENLDIASTFNGETETGSAVTFGPMILIEKNIVTQEEVETTWSKLSPRFDISSEKYIPMDFPVLYLPEQGDYAVFVKATVDNSGTEIELFDGFRLNWENHRDYGAGYREYENKLSTNTAIYAKTNLQSYEFDPYYSSYYLFSFLSHYDSNYTTASSGLFYKWFNMGLI